MGEINGTNMLATRGQFSRIQKPFARPLSNDTRRTRIQHRQESFNIDAGDISVASLIRCRVALTVSVFSEMIQRRRRLGDFGIPCLFKPVDIQARALSENPVYLSHVRTSVYT